MQMEAFMYVPLPLDQVACTLSYPIIKLYFLKETVEKSACGYLFAMSPHTHTWIVQLDAVQKNGKVRRDSKTTRKKKKTMHKILKSLNF